MFKYLSISAISLLLLSLSEEKVTFAFSGHNEHFFDANRHAVDSTLLAPFSNNELTSFYRLNNFKTVWTSAENRILISNVLLQADQEGLDPNDYQGQNLIETEKRVNSLSENDLVKYDIAITLAIQKYVSHMYNGKLNPKDLYDDWDLKAPTFDINKNLTDAVAGIP